MSSSGSGSSSSSSEERKDGDPNAFLSSMTFASGVVTRNCDCDECGLIPLSIASAIREHKRRRTNAALPRTQDRSLVCRESDVSVWKVTMPLDAEPLIEFGNSHRIVYIDTLSSQSSLVSIGKGIIGSSDEGKSRVQVDWKQGMAYLLPPNGGKAIGLVHSKNDHAPNDPIGHAIMYTIKIPPRVMLLESNSDAMQEWVQYAIATIINQTALAQSNAFEMRTDKRDTSLGPWVQLSNDDSLLVREIIHELIDSKERK